MSLIPAQCRAARALLGWSQQDLERASRVAKKTIADFERGARNPFPRTLDDLVEALEKAGIEFTGPMDNSYGSGVRFKWGMEEQRSRLQSVEDVGGKTGSGLSASPWDDDFPEASHDPDFPPLEITDEMRDELRVMLQTLDISPSGRAVLARDFGL